VAAFDATFSAPKSVSVWWALTGDPGVVEAHDVAVRAVLEHLERYGATTRVRCNGVRQHPDAAGLVLAGFGQATSREDDPQLHTHVVVSAKVMTADGRWLALDARYLKRHQRALGGLYQSVLRAELTHRYGVAWESIETGQAEITGVPRELLDSFSKRTVQVEAALADKVREFRDREGGTRRGGNAPRSRGRRPRTPARPRPTPTAPSSPECGGKRRPRSAGPGSRQGGDADRGPDTGGRQGRDGSGCG
jgi:conjugative relaxase-like TrwC/TraI family protein